MKDAGAGAYGLGAFGLAGRPQEGRTRWGLDAAARRAELRLAVRMLASASGLVYAVSGATIVGRLPGTAAALLGIAALQWIWPACGRPGGNVAPVAGAALNLLLVGVWVLSRTSGLPLGLAGPRPVGVIDALCAGGSLVLVALALALRAGSGRWADRIGAGACQIGITIAVASVAALTGGHTHGNPGSSARGGAAPAHYFCRLL